MPLFNEDNNNKNTLNSNMSVYITILPNIQNKNHKVATILSIYTEILF